jgi:hypothetical protein
MSFDGILGPVGGNKLTVEWADASHWTIDAPQTVMVVEPEPTRGELCTATVFRHATCMLPTAPFGYQACHITLRGDFGPDAITVRKRTTGAGPCNEGFRISVDVATLNGDDVVNARDGIQTNVDCGAANDVAYVDVGDTTLGCERVYRG